MLGVQKDPKRRDESRRSGFVLDDGCQKNATKNHGDEEALFHTSRDWEMFIDTLKSQDHGCVALCVPGECCWLRAFLNKFVKKEAPEEPTIFQTNEVLWLLRHH